MTILYSRPDLNIKPFRGIREASIPVDAASAVAGKHRITWTGTYNFGAFQAGQPASLIHGNAGSDYPTITGMAQNPQPQQAYYNGDGKTSENVQVLKGEAGQNNALPLVPLKGCNLLTFSLAAYSSADTDMFELRLFRAVESQDAVAYMGGLDMALATFGPSASQKAGINRPNFCESSYELPVGCLFYLQIANITNAGNTNALMGSIFLHG